MRSECSSLDAELTESQTARAQLDALAAAAGSKENAAATCTQLVVALADFVPLLDTAEALASQGTAACGTLALPEGAWRHSPLVQSVPLLTHSVPCFPLHSAEQRDRCVACCYADPGAAGHGGFQCKDASMTLAAKHRLVRIPPFLSDATGGEAIPRCSCAAQPLRTPAYT